MISRYKNKNPIFWNNLKFKVASIKKRRRLLVAHVRRQVAEVLRLDSPESIGLDQGFFELGMDSLTSIELRNRLQTSLECILPSTLGFDYPTVEALVHYLLERVSTLHSGIVLPVEALPDNTSAGLVNLATLSESEIDSLLDETLNRVEESLDDKV